MLGAVTVGCQLLLSFLYLAEALHHVQMLCLQPLQSGRNTSMLECYLKGLYGTII